MSPLKTPLPNLLLLGFAGLCLIIALTIAWVLGVSLFFPEGALAARLVERDDIIRAHIDCLMMAQFLLLFFLGFRQYAIRAPYWLVGACGFGAFFNPLAFLMRGLTPKNRKRLIKHVLPLYRNIQNFFKIPGQEFFNFFNGIGIG